ncbi:hypothetical protein Syun_023189 [Stephania yunnanensis]|uniref:Uncharacterized protein n=1 Tax=Stephania yunnanensis TaxID=152371 RepID=A0AAP0FFX3_9MAGN
MLALAIRMMHIGLESMGLLMIYKIRIPNDTRVRVPDATGVSVLSEIEDRTKQVKGWNDERRGRIALTTSYTSSKESAETTTVSIGEFEIDYSPKASTVQASEIVSSKWQVHKGQLTPAETSSSEHDEEREQRKEEESEKEEEQDEE